MSINEDYLKELVTQLLNETFQVYLRPIEKKIDELDKKMNQLNSKIEGLQFLTKEENIALREDLKTMSKK
ncbi:MAG: hypothetical protein ACW981_05740 [Candidatus Hodarchaeales archaeon]|jgi:hypothetical protein